MKIILMLSACFCFSFVASGQIKVEDHHKPFKNTVRINPMPTLFTANVNSFAVGYERVLTKRISVSSNIGHLQLPKLINTGSDSPIQFGGGKKNTGFIASLDVRFYFIDRNKYAIPDGLYWGPYTTYYLFNNTSDITIKENNVISGQGELNTRFSALMAGVQIGYQFVLGKRWTIDLIFFGPGIGFYKGAVSLSGDVDGKEEDIEAIYDALIGVFPGAAKLFENQEISKSGKVDFRSLGFRSLVQFGFRF